MIPSSRSGSAPPLVGRERELGVLRAHLDAALAGRGSLVLISGEAGIGKTALAETICQEATAHGVQVLVGRCYDLTETPPYGPWVEALGRYRQTVDAPPLPAAFAQRGTVSATTSQSESFTQTCDFLTALAACQPVLLLLDDLHWADPASLDLLRFLARQLATMPVLIVATYRTEEVTRQHPLYPLLPVLIREAHADRLDLQRLNDDAVFALVTARYLLVDRDAAPLVTYLQGRAEGNPFYLGELLRSLEAEHVLRRGADGWTVGDLTQAQIPALLQQVIDSRLRQLGDEAWPLLAIAAVIGHEVPFTLWATVASTDESALLAVVERGVAASLLDEVPDGMGARFAHALVREVAYAALRPSRRRALHRRVGDVLLMQKGTPDPDAVAYHLQRAGDDRAVAWLVKAGKRAQRAFAWRTAKERYMAALALVDSSGTDVHERGWLLYRLIDLGRLNEPRVAAYCEEARQIATNTGDHVLLALSLFWQGCAREDVRTGLAEMAASLAIMADFSPADRTRLAALESVAAFDEEYARGRYFARLFGSGRYAEALGWVKQMPPDLLRDRATGSRRPSFGLGYRGLGYLYAALGQSDEARRAFTLAREALEARGEYPDAGVAATYELQHVVLTYQTDDLVGRQRLAAIATALWKRVVDSQADLPAAQAQLSLMFVDGRWAEARAVAHAEFAVGGYIIRTYNLFRSVILAVAHAQGDVALAQTLLAEALPAGLATDHEDQWDFRDNLICQRLAAGLAIDTGDLPTAHAWLEMHDRWLAWSGSVFGRADGALGWARYHRVAGDPDRAYHYATEALALATDPRQPLALLAAHRLLGELDTEAGRHADAAAHLDASLALADACAAPYERALTLLARAALLAATNDRAQAVATLTVVRALCIPLDAKPILAHAAALATRLTATNQNAPDYPARLSAREVEVLRLIAAGRTNHEIADALFIAEKTVERHITHILTKANLTNRAAAATFATHHGLL